MDVDTGPEILQKTRHATKSYVPGLGYVIGDQLLGVGIKFPMENHINQKQEAIYSPPPDGLLLPAFAIEMAPSSRISAFFLLPSFR